MQIGLGKATKLDSRATRVSTRRVAEGVFGDEGIFLLKDVTSASSLFGVPAAAFLSGSRPLCAGLLRLSTLLFVFAIAPAWRAIGDLDLSGGAGETRSLLQPLQGDEDVIEAAERSRYPPLGIGVH